LRGGWMESSVYIAFPPAVIAAVCRDMDLSHQSGNVMTRPRAHEWSLTTAAANRSAHLLPRPSLAENHFRRHSAATRCARAWAMRASSSTGTIGAKSRCAIHSGRVNLVMWLETAQSVRYTILRGEGVMVGGGACPRVPWNLNNA